MKNLLFVFILGLQLLNAQHPGGIEGVSAWFQTTVDPSNPMQFLWTDLSQSQRKLMQNNQPNEYVSATFREINFASWGLFFDKSTSGGWFTPIVPVNSHTLIAPFIPINTQWPSINLWSFQKNNQPLYKATLDKILWQNSLLSTLDYGSTIGVDWFSSNQNAIENRGKILSYRLYDKNDNPTRLYTNGEGKTKLLLGENLGGYIPEFIFFDRILDDYERLKIESYLAIKYGITLNENPYLNPSGQKLWLDKENTPFHHRVTGLAQSSISQLHQIKSTTQYEEPYNGNYSIETESNPGLTVNSPNRVLAIGLSPQEDRYYNHSLTYYSPNYSYIDLPFQTVYSTGISIQEVNGVMVYKNNVNFSFFDLNESGFGINEVLKQGDYITWKPKGNMRVGLSHESSTNFDRIDNYISTRLSYDIYSGKGRALNKPTLPSENRNNYHLGKYTEGETFKVERGRDEIIFYKGDTPIYSQKVELVKGSLRLFVSFESKDAQLSDLKFYRQNQLLNPRPNNSYGLVDKPGDGFIHYEKGRISKSYPINIPRGEGRIRLDRHLTEGDRIHWRSYGNVKVGVVYDTIIKNYLNQTNGELSVGFEGNVNLYSRKWNYIQNFDKLTLERKNGKLLFYQNGLLLGVQAELELREKDPPIFFELGTNKSFVDDFVYEPYGGVGFEAQLAKSYGTISSSAVLDLKLQEGDYITWKTSGSSLVGVSQFPTPNENIKLTSFGLSSIEGQEIKFFNKSLELTQFFSPLNYTPNDILKLEIKNNRILYYKNDILLNGQSNTMKENVGSWFVNIALSGTNKITDLNLYKINPDYHRLDESYLVWGDNNDPLTLDTQNNQLLKGIKMLKRKWKVKAHNSVRKYRRGNKMVPARLNVEVSLNRINEKINNQDGKFLTYSGAIPTGLKNTRRQWLIIDTSGEGTFAPENVRMIEQNAYNQFEDEKLWFKEVGFDADGNGTDHFTFGYTDGFLVGTDQTPVDCLTKQGSLTFWIETKLADVFRPTAPFSYKISSSSVTGFQEKNGSFTKLSDTIQINNLTPGSYVLEVKDANNHVVLSDFEFIDSKINIFKTGNQIINPVVFTYDPNLNNSFELNAKDNINTTVANDLIYTWTLPDNSKKSGSTIKIENQGIYQIEITDAKGCIYHKDQFEVHSFISTLTVPNNPTSNGSPIKVYLDFKTDVSVQEAQVYDSNGLLLYRQSNDFNLSSKVITLQPIHAPGMYFVTLILTEKNVQKTEYFKLLIN